VIQLLSIQSRRNIVPSPNVEGTVVANLYDVTFDEALDAILQQNGAGYVEEGNFIYIYTAEELREREEAQRKRIHKVIKLNYMTAEDASTFVEPLLSGNGSISISGNVSAGFQPSVADGGADSNAHAHRMVIHDYEEHVKEIHKVIEELDVPPMQVLVEATILKADITEDLAFGVDFSILSDIAVDAFNNPLNTVNDILDGETALPTDNGQVINSTVGNTAGSGGFKVGVVQNNVAAFVRALDSVTDTTVVANPKLLALNRQRADVLVGERIGFLSTTATSTATTETVEFLDTGTQLTVRPFASRDGMIRLEIKPRVSSARIREVIPGTSGTALTIPDEITQELTTNVMVRDGQTVVLGGLFKEETTISRNQVPGLGSLPIAGAAFRGHDDSMVRSEVIFLITPRIVKDSPLYESGKAAKDDVQRVRLGAREHLLPWSRSKLSAAHLREALEAMENGNRDKALWEVDLALGLNPKQVEAIRLKEKLTGQRTYFPSESLLDDAVGVMMEKQTGQTAPDHRQTPVKPDPTPSKPFGRTDSASPEARARSIERQHDGAEFFNGISDRRLGKPRPASKTDPRDPEPRSTGAPRDGESTLPPQSKPVEVETVTSSDADRNQPVKVDLEDDADWGAPIDVPAPSEEAEASATPATPANSDTRAAGGPGTTDTEAGAEAKDAAADEPVAGADRPAGTDRARLAAPVEATPEAPEAPETTERPATNDDQTAALRAVDQLIERLEDSPFAASDVTASAPADAENAPEPEAKAKTAETADATDDADAGTPADGDQPDDATANVPVK